jgi:cation:H+ antiporter
MLLIQFLLLLLGLSILWGGAELLVKGSANLAIGIGIRPLVVGLTIVAMGTSSPELAVSLIAALRDTKELALANIVGSNIANIGLVIAVCAMIRPLKIERAMFRQEIPILLIGTLAFSLMCLDGVINYIDGIILLAGFSAFLFFMIKSSKKDRIASKANDDFVDISGDYKEVWTQMFYVIIGLVGLIGGSHFIVNSAQFIAAHFNISPVVIGLSIVAIGTSLPELAISAVGTARGQADIAVGNAIGSNIFNTLFVIAIVAIITPIPVEASMLKLHFPVMAGFTLVSVPMLRTQFCLTRWEGALLFLAYLAFLVYAYL